MSPLGTQSQALRKSMYSRMMEGMNLRVDLSQVPVKVDQEAQVFMHTIKVAP